MSTPGAGWSPPSATSTWGWGKWKTSSRPSNAIGSFRGDYLMALYRVQPGGGPVRQVLRRFPAGICRRRANPRKTSPRAGSSPSAPRPPARLNRLGDLSRNPRNLIRAASRACPFITRGQARAASVRGGAKRLPRSSDASYPVNLASVIGQKFPLSPLQGVVWRWGSAKDATLYFLRSGKRSDRRISMERDGSRSVASLRDKGFSRQVSGCTRCTIEGEDALRFPDPARPASRSGTSGRRPPGGRRRAGCPGGPACRRGPGGSPRRP